MSHAATSSAPCLGCSSASISTFRRCLGEVVWPVALRHMTSPSFLCANLFVLPSSTWEILAQWRSVHTFRAYLSTVCLLFIFLSAEINVFYLKYLLWIPADHPLVTIRLAFFFLWALPGVREYYEYVTYGRKIKRMGAHASTALITVLVELLCIYKWSADEFPAPAPRHIKISWAIFATLLVVYPAIRFGLPALRRRGKKRRSRASSPAPREDVPTPSRKQNGYAGPSARRRREV